MDEYTRMVYTRPMGLKWAFKAFKAVVENSSGHRIGEVVTDNVRALSMGEKREICEKKGHHAQHNGLVSLSVEWGSRAEADSPTGRAPLKFLWSEAYTKATYVQNGTPTRAMGD